MSGDSRFESTHWSVVLQAAEQSLPESREALAALCRIYWYPLYAYLRRRGQNVHESQDLVQGFFVHVLEHNVLAVADPTRGRFRSFLLAALSNFVANQRQKAQAQKRGDGTVPLAIDVADGESRYCREPAHDLTPERLYERQWAVTLLDHVMARLREVSAGAGDAEQFDCLKTYLAGPSADVGYAEAAAKLGMSKAAVMTAVSRLRRRYREMLRAEIARTVTHSREVEDEIRRLFDALAG